MYERFTDRARKVMQLANQEAQRFNHEYIGTEHVLLGLVKEGSGVAANVLKNLDVDLRKIRLDILGAGRPALLGPTRRQADKDTREAAATHGVHRVGFLIDFGAEVDHQGRHIFGLQAIRQGAQTEIGGNDRYVALCRRHFVEQMRG